MISLVAGLLLGSVPSPLVELSSPVTLYRSVGPSHSEFVSTNRSLDRLSHMSRKAQIAAQLAFIEKAYLPAADAGPGARYEWRPVYDIGKLDVLRVAMGKGVTLQDAKQLSFLERDPVGRFHVRRRAGSTVNPHAPYDPMSPRLLRGRAAYERAKRLILLGSYVLSRGEAAKNAPK